MNVIEELKNEYWNTDDRYGSVIADYIEADGFDVSDFKLFQCVGGYYEFVKENDRNRGFILYYDPYVVFQPEPEYHVNNGNISYPYSAKTITEAYIKHNRIELTEEDYKLMQIDYGKIKSLKRDIGREENRRGENSFRWFYPIPSDEADNLKDVNTFPLDATQPITVSEMMDILSSLDPQKPLFVLDDNEEAMGVMDIKESDSRLFICLF